MKAIVVSALGDADVLQWRDLPHPKPGDGEILIRVIGTSVNFADIKARQGRYHGVTKLPFVPGLDVAGVVEEVGSGVTRFQRGMRVVAFPQGGSYAEYVLAKEILTYSLPDSIGWEAAAAFPLVGFTAYALLSAAGQLAQGESVLVHAAAGGVGTTASQLANIMGAAQVIGVVSRKEKVAMAAEAGAHQIIDTSKADFHEAVLEMTDGRGVDLVLDSIGGKVAEESMLCLAPFGRLVHFGSASKETGLIAVEKLHASCRSVRGFSLGTVRQVKPAWIEPWAHAVLELISSRQLSMKIGRHYPLSEAADAQRWMESRSSVGKILLDVASYSH